MAEPLPPQDSGAGGSGLFASRIFGVPTLAWVAGIALLAWLYLSRRRSSASNGAVSESGGGGTASSTTTIDRGAVTIDITQNPQPKPPVKKKRKGTHSKDKDIKVPNVVGQPYEKGSEAIEDVGLSARRGTPYVGTVRREKPRAGSKVEKGSTVTLFGRKGENENG